MSDYKEIVEKLGLQAHPEGGYFREVFRSTGSFNPPADSNYSGSRSYFTLIYYLLPFGARSRYHRLKSDEIWQFVSGAPVQIDEIFPDGTFTSSAIGREIGDELKLIPAGTNFSAAPVETSDRPEKYSLVTCFVAPGFEYDDFELRSNKDLVAEFPHLKEIICKGE